MKKLNIADKPVRIGSIRFHSHDSLFTKFLTQKGISNVAFTFIICGYAHRVLEPKLLKQFKANPNAVAVYPDKYWTNETAGVCVKPSSNVLKICDQLSLKDRFNGGLVYKNIGTFSYDSVVEHVESASELDFCSFLDQESISQIKMLKVGNDVVCLVYIDTESG